MICAGENKENLGDIRFSVSRDEYFAYIDFVQHNRGYKFTHDLARSGLPVLAPTLLVVWP